MTPYGVCLTLLLCGVVLAAPRRAAVLGILAAVLYLSLGQAVLVLNIKVTALRFVELAALARLVLRDRIQLAGFNLLDKSLVALYAWVMFTTLLRGEAITEPIGRSIDMFILFFSFRALVRNSEEFRQVSRDLALLLIPFVPCLLIEARLGEPVFFGAAVNPENIREGRLRCVGSFQHPSLCGSVGALVLPMLVGLGFRKADRVRAALGLVVCLAIVWASNSGGPVGALTAGLAAWACWPLRHRMRDVRWGLVLVVVGLSLVMKSPVYYVLMKFSELTGGDGWHRSFLIEQFLGHFRLWWLIGMPLEGTVDWFPYHLFIAEVADITNSFVAFGLSGGLVGFGLYIFVFVRCFQGMGRALQQTRSGSPNGSVDEALLWGLGCVMVGHIMNQCGITYFDQFNAIWCWHLAVISNLGNAAVSAAQVVPVFGQSYESSEFEPGH